MYNANGQMTFGLKEDPIKNPKMFVKKYVRVAIKRHSFKFISRMLKRQ